MESGKLCGDGNATSQKKCEKWLEEQFHCHKTLLTPSCTASLEMAAILLDIKPGDEVIMPSFHFCFDFERLCFTWCNYCVCRYSSRHHEP